MKSAPSNGRSEGNSRKEITKRAIARGFGIAKRPPGSKSLAEEWAEYKQEERELEERRDARHRSGQF